MRIALVSRTIAEGGGASAFAERLTEELRRRGEEADLITIHPHSPSPVARPLFRWRWLASALARLQFTSQRLFGLVLPFETPALLRRLRGYDIVHFHDVWSAISPWSIRQASRRMPTVLTLHDCAPFTGGCLYMLDCPRYQKECGRCPEKRTSYHPLYRWDFSRSALMLKRRLLRKTAIALITPSQWMAARAAESAVFPSPATVIPNGCDLECFHPRRRGPARARWGIAPEERVILLSAASLDDPRKGIADAIAALNSLSVEHLNLSIMLMGRNTAAVQKQLVSFHCRDLGFLSRQEDTADAYAASDLFLFPSRADNCPLAVQESMASGTPVIAYTVGGMPEMIGHSLDGVLIANGRPDQLKEAIIDTLTDRQLHEKFGRASRTRAGTLWPWSRCIPLHMQLYQKLGASVAKSVP